MTHTLAAPVNRTASLANARQASGASSATALLALLAACARPSPHLDIMPAPLRSYAEAARFLPPGLSSYSFAFWDVGEGKEGPTLQLREVNAGSDFRKPQGMGIGWFHGVRVTEYAPGGLENFVGDVGPPSTTIAGWPVWEAKQVGEGQSVTWAASWWARIHDRITVESNERDVLEQSVSRHSEIAELLAPFPAIALLPDDAEDIVCLLPRPNDHTYAGRPVPIETMVIAICMRPRRVEIYHREAMPPEFSATLDLAADMKLVTTRRVGEFVVTEAPLSKAAPIANLRLMVAALFGYSMFF